jgi:uncharacterized membrane protein HdeD (DUF308 family)
MTTTIVLAQILGIVFTVAGLSIIINKRGVLFMLEESVHQPGLLWVLGFITITFGAVILTFNNTWSSGLVSLITFLGWLCILKGICLLCFPKFSISVYKKWANAGLLMLSGLAATVIGLVLLYKGFM